ncbi:MFS transporter [Corallococcus llansteffanensis]|uniref:MFS transporter n=1 Tax=Corallococcus llansteffanensis TaxID=2316731 RepID=UPI00244CD6FA|nr:MFS transporter [Corallococcus llansteffanensis]
MLRLPTSFLAIWLGQLVSTLGTGVGSFAITVWLWSKTQHAVSITTLEMCSFGVVVLVSPLAGALVDRLDRRWAMAVADLGVGAVILGVLYVDRSVGLEPWHLYVAKLLTGAFVAFQTPAYLGVVTVLLPKEAYARASGLMSLSFSLSGLLAPVIAATLYSAIGLHGILALDVASFAFAVALLLFVRIPGRALAAVGGARPRLLDEATYGFRTIFASKSLIGLLFVLAGNNFLGMFGILLPALVLARTGGQEPVLASVMVAGAMGGIAGGIVTGIWGGPRRRIHGILWAILLNGVFGQLLLGLGQTPMIWRVASFLSSFLFPILHGCNQAIWQSKIPADAQGRIFAARRIVVDAMVPVAMLIAGPLADYVLEPALAPGGVPILSRLVGTGPGSGMSAIFLFVGLAAIALVVFAYRIPSIRNIETLVPDASDTACARPAVLAGNDA